MKFTLINPRDFPLEPNENWFLVDPNNVECTFSIPEGSMCCCTKDFRSLKSGTLYIVSQHSQGWVTVVSAAEVIKMPEYLYARHFDAEAYVVNRNMPHLRSQATNYITIED